MLFFDGNRVDVNSILKPSFLVRYLDVVAAHLPLAHESVLGKRPVLQAVRPPPLAALVVPLVPELDRNLSLGWLAIDSCLGPSGISRLDWLTQAADFVLSEGKELLPQAIAVLFSPLLGQEVDDLVAAVDELVAVPPDGVWGVSHLNRLRVPTSIWLVWKVLRVRPRG